MLSREICNVDLLTDEQIKKWVKSFDSSAANDVCIWHF